MDKYSYTSISQESIDQFDESTIAFDDEGLLIVQPIKKEDVLNVLYCKSNSTNSYLEKKADYDEFKNNEEPDEKTKLALKIVDDILGLKSRINGFKKFFNIKLSFSNTVEKNEEIIKEAIIKKYAIETDGRRTKYVSPNEIAELVVAYYNKTAIKVKNEFKKNIGMLQSYSFFDYAKRAYVKNAMSNGINERDAEKNFENLRINNKEINYNISSGGNYYEYRMKIFNFCFAANLNSNVLNTLLLKCNFQSLDWKNIHEVIYAICLDLSIKKDIADFILDTFFEYVNNNNFVQKTESMTKKYQLNNKLYFEAVKDDFSILNSKEILSYSEKEKRAILYPIFEDKFKDYRYSNSKKATQILQETAYNQYLELLEYVNKLAIIEREDTDFSVKVSDAYDNSNETSKEKSTIICKYIYGCEDPLNTTLRKVFDNGNCLNSKNRREIEKSKIVRRSIILTLLFIKYSNSENNEYTKDFKDFADPVLKQCRFDLVNPRNQLDALFIYCDLMCNFEDEETPHEWFLSLIN